MEALKLISNEERVQSGLLLIKRIYLQRLTEKILHMIKQDYDVVDSFYKFINLVREFLAENNLFSVWSQFEVDFTFGQQLNSPLEMGIIY